MPFIQRIDQPQTTKILNIPISLNASLHQQEISVKADPDHRNGRYRWRKFDG
jgi:hypothetical protein